MRDFASDDVMARHPCYVVAPQCPENVQWVDTPWTADQHTMPDQPTEPMRLSLQLIDALLKEFPIDERRLYVTGLSMGGFGVWDALQRLPDRFAAAAPICAGGDTELAPRIKHIPLWVFHGDGDTVVKPRRSRDMVAALRKAGGEPRYTEYTNTGHNSWAATYANRELYDWLFAQVKGR
jgi:predicted peptidase